MGKQTYVKKNLISIPHNDGVCTFSYLGYQAVGQHPITLKNSVTVAGNGTLLNNSIIA